MDRLTVSRLADETGISSDTVRYYERIGLLAAPARTPSGYRQYDVDAVERVRFIKRAQRFGLRLVDIGDLLDVRERGMCPCGHTQGLLESRLRELDEEMASLDRLRRDIHTMLQHAEPGGSTANAGCGPLCRAGLSDVGQYNQPDPANQTIETNRITMTTRSSVTMSSTQQCGCASGTTTNAVPSAEPCQCGCCAPPQTRQSRIAELRSLRDSLDQELAALESA